MTKGPERTVRSAHNRLGLLGLIATVLVALFGFIAPAASAASFPHAQTRVAAIEQPATQIVELNGTIPRGGSRERAANYDQTAPGSSVASEGGAGAVNTGDVSVYTSTNAAGDVDYVGITNNIARRAGEQLSNKGINIDAIPGLENLSRADARAVEQVLIEENGGPGGGQLINKINSISPNNAIYQQSIQRGCVILGTIGYPAPNVCG